MESFEKFVTVSALLCETARAKMLWHLLDGRAYTATELSSFAEISNSSASNHLSKLLDSGILKVEKQGRHRYYAFSSSEVAYAIEALAQLARINSTSASIHKQKTSGIQYCRTCYDHLAGFVGVKIVEGMEDKGFLKKHDKRYEVTGKGWDWLSKFNLFENQYTSCHRAVTRQCLDWSERRPHLGGKLGADLLQAMLDRNWFKKVQFSRELVVTPTGSQEIYELLGISIH